MNVQAAKSGKILRLRLSKAAVTDSVTDLAALEHAQRHSNRF
jgi:hypothetical protein